jgi:hypothetical protein
MSREIIISMEITISREIIISRDEGDHHLERSRASSRLSS